MKSVFLLIVLCIFFINKNIDAQVKKPKQVLKTVDSEKGISQSIFYDYNKNSPYYKNITSFKLNKKDKEIYTNSLAYFAINKIKLKKQKTILPANNWVTLKLFKGALCVYHPCDFYTYYKMSVNDSTFIDWTGEGPIASSMENQKKINSSTFKLSLNGIGNQHKSITIKIIDKQRGIAVFTESTKTDSVSYLMIMANKIKSVPLIVNNCEFGKQLELKFEEPNFEQLLK